MKIRQHLSLIAYLSAVGSFIVGVVVAATGNDLLGSFALSGSLIIACTTFMVDRVDQVEKRILADVPVLQAFASQIETDTPAAKVLKRASKNFGQLAAQVAKGRVAVTNSEVQIGALIDITQSAHHTIDAVDRFSFASWLTSEMFEPAVQAHREASARGVKIVRVRLVEASMLAGTDTRAFEYRSMLNRYRKLQQEIGVDIHFLADDSIIRLQLSDIERGWMLADQGDPVRVAGIYGILKEGIVREGAILFGESPETLRLADEFRRILAAAKADDNVASFSTVFN